MAEKAVKAEKIAEAKQAAKIAETATINKQRGLAKALRDAKHAKTTNLTKSVRLAKSSGLAKDALATTYEEAVNDVSAAADALEDQNAGTGADAGDTEHNDEDGYEELGCSEEFEGLDCGDGEEGLDRTEGVKRVDNTHIASSAEESDSSSVTVYAEYQDGFNGTEDVNGSSNGQCVIDSDAPPAFTNEMTTRPAHGGTRRSVTKIAKMTMKRKKSAKVTISAKRAIGKKPMKAVEPVKHAKIHLSSDDFRILVSWIEVPENYEAIHGSS